MRFEHFYFDSRVIGPLHEMLRDSEIELVRLAVPYCISFEERLRQLGAAKALAAATGSSTPSPDSIPIVCDLWLLDSKNQLYRATMRSDSRFSFLPLSTSSSQPLFLKTIFSTPDGRVMGIDLSGNLLQDYSPSTDLASKVHNNLDGSISYNTTPTGGSISLIGMDATLSPLIGGSPTTFADATFIDKVLVGIDPYGNVWRRLPNSLWTSSSCLTSSQDPSPPHLLPSPPSPPSSNLLASGEFIWAKSVQDAKIHLASISGVWGLDKSGSLLKVSSFSSTSSSYVPF
jgi:hypothetical protein